MTVSLLLVFSAIAAAVLCVQLRGGRVRGGRSILIVVGLLCLAVFGYQLVNVSSNVSDAKFGDVQVATTGWGLYVGTAGAATLLAFSVLAARARPKA